MCILGEEINRFERNEANPITGYRGWFIKNSFALAKKILKSESANYDWPLVAMGDISIEERGVFSYNHNCYYHSYYHNYYHNYYNYNQNCYYSYYWNHYYRNCYYVYGITANYGKIIEHKEGYRSEFSRPIALVLLDKHKDEKFLEHFNKIVTKVANEYKCKVITQEEFERHIP